MLCAHFSRFCPDILAEITSSTSQIDVCLHVENCPATTSGALWQTGRICLIGDEAGSRCVDQQTEGDIGYGAQSKGKLIKRLGIS